MQREEKKNAWRKRWRDPGFLLVLALALCLVSAAGSAVVKTGAGSVTVRKLKWETPSGHLQNAQLFIPDSATAQSKAPAVAVCHGWNSENELMTPNYVELSRRGFVVLAIDMYGHGDSEDIEKDTWFTEAAAGNGLYDGVKLLAALPYVDVSQIGVVGHSNGAMACNVSVMLDNEAPTRLISAVFLECNDAFYNDAQLYARFFEGDGEGFSNVYSNRDVAVTAAKYDECFHRVRYSDGTVTSPRDYIDQPTAQSFLHFGADPAGLEKREAGVIYTETVDGAEATRVVYTPGIIHCWGFMSSEVTREFLTFFQLVFRAPNPIDPGRQVYQIKQVFEAVGVAGFLLFLPSFILVMLRTRYFGVLASSEEVQLREVDRRGKTLFWRGLSFGALFSALSFPVFWVIGNLLLSSFFNQLQPWVMGIWTLANGLFTFLLLRRNYRRYAKGQGLDLREEGVLLSRDKAAKTVLLAVLAAACTYSLVFLSNYFFTTDFRLWVLLVFRPFDAASFAGFLKFLFFFVAFYTVNAAATTVFNRVKIGKKPWVTTAVLCLFNTLGVVVLIAFYYTWFFVTGLLPLDTLAWGAGTMIMWIYPVVLFLPIATLIHTAVYRKTRNPYLSGIAFGLIVTVMTCTFTLSWKQV